MCSTTVWDPDSSHSKQHTRVRQSNAQSHIRWLTLMHAHTHTHTRNYSLAASTDAKLYIMLCITSGGVSLLNTSKHIGLVCKSNHQSWKIVAQKSKYNLYDRFKHPLIQSLVTIWKSDQGILALSLLLMCLGLCFVAHVDYDLILAT